MERTAFKWLMERLRVERCRRGSACPLPTSAKYSSTLCRKARPLIMSTTTLQHRPSIPIRAGYGISQNMQADSAEYIRQQHRLRTLQGLSGPVAVLGWGNNPQCQAFYMAEENHCLVHSASQPTRMGTTPCIAIHIRSINNALCSPFSSYQEGLAAAC